MTGNLAQDWPVYVLLTGVVFFIGYVIVKGNMENKDAGKEQKSGKP